MELAGRQEVLPGHYISWQTHYSNIFLLIQWEFIQAIGATAASEKLMPAHISKKSGHASPENKASKLVSYGKIKG